MKQIFTLILFACAAGAAAQTPQLLKNINPNTSDPYSGSEPGKGVNAGGKFYFPATSLEGRELWFTNGLAAGTDLTHDAFSIFPGDNASPQLLTAFGDTVFFFAGTDIKLYRYIQSTGRIKQVFSSTGQTPTEAVRAGRWIYFNADAYFGNGVELLRYNVDLDYVDAIDVNAGPDGSLPHSLTPKGDSLFFVATDVVNGTEIWMLEGSSNSPVLQGDIMPGNAPSNPVDLVVYNDKLFFTADDGVFGNELWSCNGNMFSAALYIDINQENSGLDPSDPLHKTVFNGKLYFSANDGFNGVELWSVDDDQSTIVFVLDINPFGDSYPGRYGMHVAGNKLYFSADDGNDGAELWSTDGTVTELVKDINPFGDSNPMDMYNIGSTLYFVAEDGSNDLELWRSDGTGATTNMVLNVQPPSSDTLRICGVSGSTIYFSADNGTNGRELWKSNGLAAGTSMVKDIHVGQSASGIISPWFEPYNGQLYFTAQNDGSFQQGLYRTDGTTAGTVEVVPPGGADNFSAGYAKGRKAGTTLYFEGNTTSAGNELWKSDGTPGGTAMVKDINPGTITSSIELSLEYGSLLLFIADDGTNGRELWKSDGTTGGTAMVKDIYPGVNSSDIRDLRLLNGKVIFVANDGTTGAELWITDGSTAGTVRIKDINNNAAGSDISNVSVIGNTLYFSADDGVHGAETWTSDGTTGGTSMLKDLRPGPDGSSPNGYAQLGSWVYFSAAEDNNPAQVWRTDGTAVNTSVFYAVNYPFFFHKVGSRLCFMTLPASSTNGFHMWATDGTIAGTTEIEDFLPGEMGYLLLDEFPVYNNKWFLWLDNNLDGQELWETNGTAAGTKMYDIAAGVHSSYPRAATGLNNTLVFAAYDGTTVNYEPYKLDVTAVLPITGLQFNATRQQDKALLAWTTLTEENNKGFTVQRSANGLQFDSIGYVVAAGVNGRGADYRFTDEHPLPGKNYYRLLQKDWDSRGVFSPVRWVEFSKEGYIRTYPNPSRDVLNISTSYTFSNATLTIRNSAGAQVYRSKLNGSGTISIPVSQLPAGVYHGEIVQPGQQLKLAFIRQ